MVNTNNLHELDVKKCRCNNFVSCYHMELSWAADDIFREMLFLACACRVCLINSGDILGTTCVGKMKETTYPLGSANTHTQAQLHRDRSGGGGGGGTDKDTHTSDKAESTSRSGRIWTWFKESPGCVIFKYLPWDLRQVIHKQLFWGDNRQACHIRSPLFKCTQAGTNAASAHIRIRSSTYKSSPSPFLPLRLSFTQTHAYTLLLFLLITFRFSLHLTLSVSLILAFSPHTHTHTPALQLTPIWGLTTGHMHSFFINLLVTRTQPVDLKGI